MKISDDEGQILVTTVRLALLEFLLSGKRLNLSENFKNRFSWKSGVFVTLNKSDELRGCIGFPTPENVLYQSLVDAAVAAAIEDPRFSPVGYNELGEISIEVTILSPPSEIQVDDQLEYPTKIKVGRDGLIIKWKFGSGLLLPQVPVEYGWDEIEFLNHTCEKAGAPQNCWKMNGTKIFKFEGLIFKEIKPNGRVIRVLMGK